MTWYGFAENSRAEEEKYVQHKVTVTISDEWDKSRTNSLKSLYLQKEKTGVYSYLQVAKARVTSPLRPFFAFGNEPCTVQRAQKAKGESYV